MMINSAACTKLDEIADGIYRINTPVALGGGPAEFSFNQYLIRDEAPLLFHTGPRRLFPFVMEAVSHVLPVRALKYVALSHFEADECGALNAFLTAAPHAVPVCGHIAALTSIEDYADRPPRVLADAEELALGRHTVRWLDTPHVPHAWECGRMMELSTRTFLCGDLFTQGGAGEVALTSEDIFAPSEAFRRLMDYFAHSRETPAILERLAMQSPRTLACMHGSAWSGDGSVLLKALAAALA